MKSSSVFFEEEIIFKEEEIDIIKNPQVVFYFYYYSMIVFSFFFFLIVLITLGLDVFYERILIICYSFLGLYILNFHFKDSFSLFSLLRINKRVGILEFLNKKGQVRKTVFLGELKYMVLEHATYGGGKGSFASVVLVGEKSKMSLKKFEFQYSPREAFDAAYQWAIPIAKCLEIDVKKEI